MPSFGSKSTNLTTFQGLPVPNDEMFVWVFIPYEITPQGWVSEVYDNEPTRSSLADVFAELGMQWKWQPITFDNMHAVIQEVVASTKEYFPVVLNYCDGDEINGYPGVSVVKLLEEKGIVFTGADSNFYYISTDKLLMKRAFVEAAVGTAPYEVILDNNQIEGVEERLGTPLMVKPAISASSCGISLQSVVHSDEQVDTQVQRLLQGQHGLQFARDTIYVEKFLGGAEFTIFIVGSVNQPENIKIYPPAQRVFHSELPEAERFLSFDRYWGKYEKETPLSPDEPFYRYQLAASELSDKLSDVSFHAYCAVRGTGYGRVDIRIDKDTQQLCVLEVNANCGISNDDQTSLGNILHLSGIPFTQLMTDILAEAFAKQKAAPKFAILSNGE